MAVSVRFLGLCLFVWEEHHVRVLLPRADSHDGLKRMHHAYLADTRVPLWKRLSGHSVYLNAKGPRPGRINTDVPIINLRKMISANGLNLRPRPSVELFNADLLAAEVILTDGDLEFAGPAKNEAEYHVDGHPSPLETVACCVTWKHARLDEITIRCYEDGVLDAEYTGTDLVIGNTDDPRPSNWYFDEIPCNPGDVIPDHDFAWYFRLYDGNAGALRVPRAEGTENRSGTTSTCYNGEHCGDDYPC